VKPVCFGVFALLIPLAACAGDVLPKPNPGITRAESAKVAPYPPQEVKVVIDGQTASLRWDASDDSKIVGYEIFRGVNGGPLEKIKRVTKAPFVDKVPSEASVRYAVAAVDSNNNVSRPRTATSIDTATR
jgi:hypothetical protein